MIRTYEMDVPARKKILYDISDLIRSGDMRRLVREAGPELDPEDVEQLILYSNKSLEDKITELRSLADVVREVSPELEYGQEASRLADMLELCLKQIYSPEERVLYVWRRAGTEDLCFYDSFRELMELWGDYDMDESDEDDFVGDHVPQNDRLSCDHVTQLAVGKSKSREILSFTMQRIRGRYVVRAVDPKNSWLSGQGVSDKTILRFGDEMDILALGIKLPENALWKFQTPSMKDPVYGVLCQKRRQNRWVFKTDDKMGNEFFDSLDTDYSGDKFSVLDWMELVPEEDLDTGKDMETELPFV